MRTDTNTCHCKIRHIACSIVIYYCNAVLTWSMAQGMRHCISFLPPKICGKELLKDGAAWMAGKLIFPGWMKKKNNKHHKEPRVHTITLTNQEIKPQTHHYTETFCTKFSKGNHSLKENELISQQNKMSFAAL